MKKKYGMLLGAGVATLGVIASVGVSFALFKKVGSVQEINIGTYTPSTDEFVYTVSTPTATAEIDNSGAGFVKTSTIAFNVGGQYPTSNDASVIAQPYYVGKLTVDITGDVIDADKLIDKATLDLDSSTFEYKSEISGTSFWTNTLTAVEEPEAGHKTFTGNIAFECGSTHGVDVALALKTTFADVDAAIKWASKKLTVNIRFEESTYDWLYVRGDFNGWAASSDYRLVPNIKATTEEFMFSNLPGSIGAMKVANDSWSCEAAAAAGGNFTPAHTDVNYSLYWHGGIPDTGCKKTLTEEVTEEPVNYIIHAN